MSYPERFTPWPPRELHNVYAYLSTGAKVLISGGLSWDGAQDRWLALDDQRRALVEHEAVAYYRQEQRPTGAIHVGEHIGHVRHFCVRSAADPNWPAAQPNHAVRVVLD